MNLLKKGGVWHVSFMGEDGKRHTRSTDQTDMKLAKEVVKLAKIEEIEIMAKAKSLTNDVIKTLIGTKDMRMDECVAEWRAWLEKHRSKATVRIYAQTMRAFLAEVGHATKVDKITEDHCDKFVNPKNTELKRASLSMRLAAIQSFFTYCTAKQYVRMSPAEIVEVRTRDLPMKAKEQKPKRPIADEEYAKIRDWLKGKYVELYVREQKLLAKKSNLNPTQKLRMTEYHFWWFAVVMAYHTGIRVSDCANFEKASFMPGKIVVWTHKSGSRVALPIDNPAIGTSDMMEVLKTIDISEGKSIYVFEYAAREYDAQPNRMSKRFRDFILQMKLPKDITFHCFRYTFAQRHARLGMSYHDIAMALGHAHYETTKIYLREVSDAD